MMENEKWYLHIQTFPRQYHLNLILHRATQTEVHTCIHTHPCTPAAVKAKAAGAKASLHTLKV